MADLQKIFTGMENGPETIEANFEAVNTKLTAGAATSTYTLSDSDKPTSATTLIHGKLYRQGSMVSMVAKYSTNGSNASGALNVIKIPVGYQATGLDSNLNVPLADDAGVTAVLVSPNMVNCLATNSLVTVAGCWKTNDDMPA